tara:strand:- start:77 stop:340 length:264 start_codon:yes stop_codon:yes gene_type:complete
MNGFNQNVFGKIKILTINKMKKLSLKQKEQLKKYLADKQIGPVGYANLYKDILSHRKRGSSEPDLEFLISTSPSSTRFAQVGFPSSK